MRCRHCVRRWIPTAAPKRSRAAPVARQEACMPERTRGPRYQRRQGRGCAPSRGDVRCRRGRRRESRLPAGCDCRLRRRSRVRSGRRGAAPARLAIRGRRRGTRSVAMQRDQQVRSQSGCATKLRRRDNRRRAADRRHRRLGHRRSRGRSRPRRAVGSRPRALRRWRLHRVDAGADRGGGAPQAYAPIAGWIATETVAGGHDDEDLAAAVADAEPALRAAVARAIERAVARG